MKIEIRRRHAEIAAILAIVALAEWGTYGLGAMIFTLGLVAVATAAIWLTRKM